MKNANPKLGVGRALIALAVLLLPPVTGHAEDGDIAALAKPESSLGAGIGVVSGNQKDRSIFGQYNGMRKDDAHLQLEFDYVKRNDATGNWTIFRGRNLGLDTREFGAELGRQGDWKFTLDYNEIVKRDIRTVNTGLTGAGTTTPALVQLATPGSGAELNQSLKRVGLGLGVEKWLSRNLQFEASFKNEEKDGSRTFGRGFTCTSGAAPGCLSSTAARLGTAFLLVPEPINSSTRQFEAKLNFTTEKLMLSGGYYGSFYNNSFGNVTPSLPGSAFNFVGTSLAFATNPTLGTIMGLPAALPPDNQAHQFYVAGNYAFTPTTRSTFKLAHTRMTQNESFAGMGLTGAPGGRSDLGGAVSNTLAQVGLTAKPMAKLVLRADLRYENRKDTTPIDVYNIEGATTFTNSHTSNKKLSGKFEGSYLLPANVRGTLGVDYGSVDRGVPVASTAVAGLSGLRTKTEETGWYGELRRSVSDTVTGSLKLRSAKRDGSDWLTVATCGALPAFSSLPRDSTCFSATGAYPMMLLNRKRDTVKATIDWAASDSLALQFVVEDGKDKYVDVPRDSPRGARSTGMRVYSTDATFSISDAWKLSGYLSRSEQSTEVTHSSYFSDVKNTSDAFGLTLNGRVNSRFTMGAKLAFINDKTNYGLIGGSPAIQTTLDTNGGLPDVLFRQTRIDLFGNYALDKNAEIRVDLVHAKARLNEWTWGNNGIPFTYSDNTTVGLNQNQSVTYVGARYIYKFR